MPEQAENISVEESGRKKKHMRRVLIFCGITLLNVGLLALLLTQLLTPAQQTPADPLLGHVAPGFSLATVDSAAGKRELALADFAGKPVVINFWATWCDPCKEEMPLLETTWKKLQAEGKDVVFLGIDFQESSSDVAPFLQQYGITYPVLLDANGFAANKYRIASLPDTFFISRQGKIVSKVLQQLTDQALTKGLQSIL
jgi:cytochrome c biogenesis protein CcmG/thiol:disulfide interchange protein DsbE